MLKKKKRKTLSRWYLLVWTFLGLVSVSNRYLRCQREHLPTVMVIIILIYRFWSFHQVLISVLAVLSGSDHCGHTLVFDNFQKSLDKSLSSNAFWVAALSQKCSMSALKGLYFYLFIIFDKSFKFKPIRWSKWSFFQKLNEAEGSTLLHKFVS